MPPRNSRIKPFKKYSSGCAGDLQRAAREEQYMLDFDSRTRKAVDFYKEILDPKDSPNNEFNKSFEQYKESQMEKGLSTENTIDMITKSEEEQDPRYKDKDWYKLRAAGDPRGWAIDGDRCDGRNFEIGRKGYRGIQ